jgi:hypothetical protein
MMFSFELADLFCLDFTHNANDEAIAGHDFGRKEPSGYNRKMTYFWHANVEEINLYGQPGSQNWN